MFDLPDYQDISKKHILEIKKVGDKFSLELRSSMDLSTSVNIVAHIVAMLSRSDATSSRIHTSSASSRRDFLQYRIRQARSRLDEDDGLRPTVKRVMALRAESTTDERAEDNAKALGGMRDPAKSIKRVRERGDGHPSELPDQPPRGPQVHHHDHRA